MTPSSLSLSPGMAVPWLTLDSMLWRGPGAQHGGCRPLGPTCGCLRDSLKWDKQTIEVLRPLYSLRIRMDVHRGNISLNETQETEVRGSDDLKPFICSRNICWVPGTGRNVKIWYAHEVFQESPAPEGSSHGWWQALKPLQTQVPPNPAPSKAELIRESALSFSLASGVLSPQHLWSMACPLNYSVFASSSLSSL